MTRWFGEPSSCNAVKCIQVPNVFVITRRSLHRLDTPLTLRHRRVTRANEVSFPAGGVPILRSGARMARDVKLLHRKGIAGSLDAGGIGSRTRRSSESGSAMCVDIEQCLDGSFVGGNIPCEQRPIAGRAMLAAKFMPHL
jgi:hypothetical protein